MHHVRFQTAALLLATSLACTVTPTPARAQSTCGSAAKMATSIWDKYGEQIKKQGCKSNEECMANATKKAAIVAEMVAWWNNMVGNSWAAIGPRELTFGGVLDGKVVAGGERLFVSKMPIDDADELSVEVTKEGGRAKSTVSISVIPEGGGCSLLGNVEFAANAANGKKTASAKGIRGKVVVVKVDAGGTQAFDYKLVVRKR